MNVTTQEIKNSQPRLAKWDNVKFVLIFLVVLGHISKDFMGSSDSIGKIVYFIYLFHMPAFVFVSGLFSKKTVDQKRWDKIISLILVLYFMKILLYVVKLIGGGSPSFSLLSESGVAWYALGMVFFMVITIGIRQFSFKVIMPISILVGCLIGYDKSVGSFLALSRVITFYPFFYLGYYLDIEKLNAFLKKKAVIIASAVWVVGVIGVILRFYSKLEWSYANFLKGKGSFETQFAGCNWLKSLDYAALIRAGYYLIVFITVIAIIALIPSVKCMVSKFGSRTLQVYAIHYSILYLIMNTCGIKAWLNGMNMKLAFLVMVAIAAVLTLVLSAGIFSSFFQMLTSSVRKEDKK